MVGEKIKERAQAVPENIRATADDVKRASVFEAITGFFSRFGRSNRRLVQK
jgi:hypothetical protein